MKEKKYKLIACEIVKMELEPLICSCKNKFDVKYMTQGLHSAGSKKMAQELQKELDHLDPSCYDAVLLAYGLCGRGVCGLHADIPIVVPKAHDCTTLFMGSKEGYKEYFDRHRGTFFFTSGTLEFDKGVQLFSKQASDLKRQEYVELYDEETADYLMETIGDPLKEYSRIAFINSGADNTLESRDKAQMIAEEKQWEFEELKGSPCIFEHMLNGDWNEEEFIIVPPGSTIQPAYTDGIITFY